MALGSQSTEVQSITDLSGLAHEIFARGVKWHVLAESVTAQVFNRATRGQDYKVRGEKLVGAAQLRFANGAMGTTKKLPDNQALNPSNWEITPVRRYRRIARDPFVNARVQGDGAFDDYETQLFNTLWDSWARMEIRHAIGDSRAYICECSARTSATVVVVKDGHGHTGTNPLMHIDVGTILAWLDASNSFAVGGAAKVSSINYGTKTITFGSNFDDGSTTIAASDPLVMATTDTTTDAHFETEYNNAPHGVGDIVDPDGNNTTMFGISETTHARWKPLRETSNTFDQYEVAEHWRKLRAYSGQSVSSQTHVVLTQAAPMSELARSLGPFQQQQQMGATFQGGYESVRISFLGGQPMDFAVDDYFYHDTVVTLHKECLYRDDLEGDADFYENDGSMWSRLPDEDLEEAYVRDYMAQWSDQRNRHAALKGITLSNVDADDFAPTPK